LTTNDNPGFEIIHMKVKVYAPLFGDVIKLDESGYLEVEQGATLKDVYQLLKIPRLLRNSLFCQVNYQRKKR
jgi:hypothetical protein